MLNPRRGHLVRGTSVLAALVFVAVLSTIAYAVHAIVPSDQMAQTASVRLALDGSVAEMPKQAPVAEENTDAEVVLESELTGDPRCSAAVKERRDAQISSAGTRKSDGVHNVCVNGCSYKISQGSKTLVASTDTCKGFSGTTKTLCEKERECVVEQCDAKGKCTIVGNLESNSEIPLSGIPKTDKLAKDYALARAVGVPAAYAGDTAVQDLLKRRETDPDAVKSQLSDKDPLIRAAYGEALQYEQVKSQADVAARERTVSSMEQIFKDLNTNGPRSADDIEAHLENASRYEANLARERAALEVARGKLATINEDLPRSIANIEPLLQPDPGETGGIPQVSRPVAPQGSTFGVPPEYNPGITFTPDERKNLENPVPKKDGAWAGASDANANQNLGPVPPLNATAAERAEAQKKYPNLDWNPNAGKAPAGGGARTDTTTKTETVVREQREQQQRQAAETQATAKAQTEATARAAAQARQDAARNEAFNRDLMKIGLQGFMTGFAGGMNNQNQNQSPYGGGYGQGGYGGGQPPIGNSVPQPPGSCGVALYCQNNMQYQRNTNCVDQIVQRCQYGCAGSQCATAPQNQCPTPAPQPSAAGCVGTWQAQQTPGPNGQTCVTGWTCSPTAAADEPTAEISCAPLIADSGMSVSISYTCGNSTRSTGTNFSTGGSLASTTSAVVPSTGNSIAYAVACASDAGRTRSASCTVQIARPSIVLVSNPSVVASGAQSTIGWVSAGMQSCTVSSPDSATFTAENEGNTTTTGSARTPALTSTMRVLLSCDTVGGNLRTASTTVTVR